MMVHWFDLFVAFFIFISAVWSYFRGFTRELFSLGALVVGYLAASGFYQAAAPLFQGMLVEKRAQEVAAFLVLFFVGVIVVVIASYYIRKALHLSEILSSADRIAGFGVGVLKGGLFLALLTYPFSLAPGVKEETLSGSLAAPVLLALSGSLLGETAPGLVEEANKAKGKSRVYEEGLETLKKLNDAVHEKITPTKQPSLSKEGETEPAPKKSESAKKQKSAQPEPITEKDREELGNILDKYDR